MGGDPGQPHSGNLRFGQSSPKSGRKDMTGGIAIALVSSALLATSALADGRCAAGKTLSEGTFTIATGNPAYSHG